MIDIAIVMGSNTDFATMQYSSHILNELDISHEIKILSVHRAPEKVFRFATHAKDSGLKVIIAGAGGAAHLPGMIASLTTIAVLGVPVRSEFLDGLDSMLSILQMPKGVPVATFTVGKAGAKNAALMAATILACSSKAMEGKVKQWRAKQTFNSSSIGG
jgi:5-(carboxyamino)imidazole ribonucleotide mutase